MKKQLILLSKISLAISLITLVIALIYVQFQNKHMGKEIFAALYEHVGYDLVVKGDTAYFKDLNGKYSEKRKITLIHRKGKELYFATANCQLAEKVKEEEKLDKIRCKKNSRFDERSIGLGKMINEDGKLQLVSYKETDGSSGLLYHNSVPEVKDLGSGRFGFWYYDRKDDELFDQDIVTLYIYDSTLLKNEKNYLTRLYRGKDVDPTLLYDDPIGFRRVFSGIVSEDCNNYSRDIRINTGCRDFTAKIYLKDGGNEYKDIVIEKKYKDLSNEVSKEVYQFNSKSKKYVRESFSNSDSGFGRDSVSADDFTPEQFESSILTDVYNELIEQGFEKDELNVSPYGLGFAWRIPENGVDEGYKAVILDQLKYRRNRISLLTDYSEDSDIYYDIGFILTGNGLTRSELNTYKIYDKMVTGYYNDGTYCLLEQRDLDKGAEISIMCAEFSPLSDMESLDTFRDINLGDPFDSSAVYIVSNQSEGYASGYTRLLETPSSNFGTVDWIARKDGTDWNVIWYGSLTPPCKYMQEEGVPEDVYKVCYDHPVEK